MILGLGNDLVDIRRIEKLLTHFSSRFESRVFTKEELQYATNKGHLNASSKASYLAKRFAAKEACAKALGTGFSNGLRLKDIEIINLENGQPTIALYGNAQTQLESLTPAGWKSQLNITMTDEYPYASAVVIVSAYS